MTEALERWVAKHVCYYIMHLRLRQVAKLVDASAPKCILGMSCAPGYPRLRLPRLTHVGSDFAAPALAPNFRFCICDPNRETLQIQLGKFDAAACLGIPEHIGDLAARLDDSRQFRPTDSFACTHLSYQYVLHCFQRVLGLRQCRHADWQRLLRLDALRGRLKATGLSSRRCNATTTSSEPAPSEAAASTFLRLA